MSAAVLFAVGQTVVFLAVCGFALWSARLTSEAAESTARAAEEAAKAAADVREMRDALRTWLDQERARAGAGGRSALLLKMKNNTERLIIYIIISY